MIEHYAPHNGRMLLNDDSIINIADVLKSVYDVDCFVTETEDKRQLRLGNAFGVGYTWQSVASAATVALHLRTGARYIYLNLEVAGVGLTDYGFVTGATVTANGTELTALRRNSMVTFNPTAIAYRDPTFTGGTVTIPRFLGSGTNPVSQIGGIMSEQSAVLAPNTSYILRATNSSGTAQARMGIIVNWREIITEV